MELFFVFVLLFVIYGAGWIWQTVGDILHDTTRGADREEGAGRSGGGRSFRRSLAGGDYSTLWRAFSRLASEREGQVLDRGPFQGPRVSYLHHVVRAVLSLHEAGEESPGVFTQISYAAPYPGAPPVEIFPRRTPDPDEPETGDSEFDARLAVASANAPFVREFLDPPTRAAIVDLRKLLANDHVHVSLSPARLMIRKKGILASHHELSLFARLSDQICDRVATLWQRANGIEIVEDAPARSDEIPTCRVCGHRVPPEGRVYCRRCRTPHHEDCWRFNEGCCIFACGEKRCLKL
ncbi:MAG: hypothetical protein HY716_15590 [Planctomycetes bacterium]|nr:hypothetical protein [Planctomycetota bacterium]